MDLIPKARPLFRELTKIQGRREYCFCFQKMVSPSLGQFFVGNMYFRVSFFSAVRDKNGIEMLISFTPRP